ncbi:MAG: DUF3704 domain-containing protein [bacterium]|nr:DUF3704 domain-containing protein [bacterium]
MTGYLPGNGITGSSGSITSASLNLKDITTVLPKSYSIDPAVRKT